MSGKRNYYKSENEWKGLISTKKLELEKSMWNIILYQKMGKEKF